MASVFNIFIEQGADFRQDFAVANGKLDDALPEAKMRRHYYSANAHTFTASVNLDEEYIRLEMNYAQTGNLRPGRYVYDVEITHSSSNTRERVVEGIVMVNPSSTY